MGREVTDVPVLVLLGGFAEKDFKEEWKTIVDHWKLKISLKKKKGKSSPVKEKRNK